MVKLLHGENLEIRILASLQIVAAPRQLSLEAQAMLTSLCIITLYNQQCKLEKARPADSRELTTLTFSDLWHVCLLYGVPR